MKEEIKNWLKKPDWKKGVDLLLQFGKKAVPHNWKNNPSPNSLQKKLLEKDLRELADVADAPIPVKVVEVVYKPEEKEEIHLPPPIAARDSYRKRPKDTILDMLAQNTQGLFNKRQMLSSQLGDPEQTDSDRAALVDEIKEIEVEMKSVNDDRNVYKNTGELPQKEEQAIEDIKELDILKRMIKQAQTNRSRAEKRLKDEKRGTRKFNKISDSIAKWRKVENRCKAQKKTL